MADFKKFQGSTWKLLRFIAEIYSQQTHFSHFDKEQVIKMNDSLNEVKKLKKEKSSSSSQSKLTSLGFTQKKGPNLDPREAETINIAMIKYLVKVNRPFSDVNNPAFREMIFAANPKFICNDRTTLTRKFDKLADQVEEKLCSEIEADVKSNQPSIISIITDHGTSQDTLRTKKMWL